MTYIASTDFLIEVAKGKVPGHSLVHKFGRNTAVGTSFVPITLGGVYQTPQAASATALRVKSGGDANDTAAGSGAREVTLEGLDETGAYVSEAVATAGASASSATSATFIRLYRAKVTASGTYATATAGSHSDDVVIENSAGGTDWATISATGFPRGTTEIGAYSVASGVTAYVLHASAYTDSNKTTELLFFQRTGILEAAAPYSTMRVLADERLEGGMSEITLRSPIPIQGPADIGFMAEVNTGTAEVDVDFELLLVND